MRQIINIVIITAACLGPFCSKAEDGSRLWLRADTTAAATITGYQSGSTAAIATEELHQQWVGAPVKLSVKSTLSKDLGEEGFRITGNELQGYTITAAREAGLLYGAYHLLRLQATGAIDPTASPAGALDISESPAYRLRLLNHWDNLDRTVERGYAGHSIWQWDELPGAISPRYAAYARANASIGINATVLNNVNATPQVLTAGMLQKVQAIAHVLRPYNIKVYLSINFSSPMVLGGLATADPLDKDVRQWWKNKVKEIYRLIPDFGGFLVKANSEGLPGPQDFGRSHADGANMLAEALLPYKGIVMWRAFVYAPKGDDRAKQAYQEFLPLDGEFLSNVIIQVKNGPIDFQPREPFSPLFGAMQHTPVMPELQITQEYLGFSNHLAYLAPLFKECLDSDTYARGEGSTVARATDGSLFGQKNDPRLSAIAGVANIGEDTNWCGHHFAQANWYAFGRLAWNHRLSAETIAREWLQQTFTTDENFVQTITELMMQSREAVVNYMMPLGLHHLFAWDHHYGPEPWCEVAGARPDWLPSYYHKADSLGLGFDRTDRGSNATAQYFHPLSDEFNSLQHCDERYLLWFHHVPWNYRMKNGNTLWEELCYHYDSGVQSVRNFQKSWDRMEHFIDPERFSQVQAKLRIQALDAVWWKDACLLYFQSYSQQAIPYDIERPVHELNALKKIRLNLKHHN